MKYEFFFLKESCLVSGKIGFEYVNLFVVIKVDEVDVIIIW